MGKKSAKLKQVQQRTSMRKLRGSRNPSNNNIADTKDCPSVGSCDDIDELFKYIANDILKAKETSGCPSDSDDFTEDIQYESFPFNLSGNARKCGNDFDKACQAMKWTSCESCNTKFPDMPMKNDHMCMQCARKPLKSSKANNMDPGSVPVELRHLTEIEKLVVAQVHPLISLY